MKLKAWISGLKDAWPGLRKLTLSVAGGTPGVTVPCALVLLAAGALRALGVSLSWHQGAASLLMLLETFAAAPAAAAMITYAAGASWESRRTSLPDAAQFARIRIREIAITGLAAGVLMLVLDWIASVIYSLAGIIPSLLGWIPLIGPVVTGIVAWVVWLISLAVEFAAHIALTAGMLPLTADGMSGKIQIERAAGILKGGGKETVCGLVLVFGLWICSRGLYELLRLALPLGGDIAACAIPAAAAALSTIAVSVIYLRQRDRQDGMKFHA